MEQLLLKILEQIPVVIALCIGIYAIYKDRKTSLKEAADKLKESEKNAAIKLAESQNLIIVLVADHSNKIEKINAYTLQRETDLLSTLRDILAILEQMSDDIKTI